MEDAQLKATSLLSSYYRGGPRPKNDVVFNGFFVYERSRFKTDHLPADPA